MPARKATASGKWSQSIWDVTPSVGDDVFANGFTVEIDQNVNVGSLRTSVSGVYATAGGGFTLFQPLSVIASPNGFLAGTTTCLTSFVTAGTAFLSGNIVGAGANSQYGLYHGSAGNVTIFGNVRGGSVNGNLGVPAGVANEAAGTITIYGDLSAGTNEVTYALTNSGLTIVYGNVYGGNGAVNQYGALNATGTLKVFGNVAGGSRTGGASSNAHGIVNSTGSVLIQGSVDGASGVNGGAGIVQNSTGTLLVSGTITASANAHGVVAASTAARNEFTGTLVNSISGRQAVYCAKYLVHPKVFDSATVQAVDRSGTYVTFYAPEAYSTSYVPHVSSVALGTAYAAVSSLSGVDVNIPVQLSGTMVVPSEASVSFGTLVGQTTGTAIHTSEQLQQVWNTNINTLTAANSLGARLKNAATVQEVGQQIQNLNL